MEYKVLLKDLNGAQKTECVFYKVFDGNAECEILRKPFCGIDEEKEMRKLRPQFLKKNPEREEAPEQKECPFFCHRNNFVECMDKESCHRFDKSKYPLKKGKCPFCGADIMPLSCT